MPANAGWNAYRARANEIQQLPTSNVVHFRNGIDPQNVRRGLSDLGAVLREVCTDNEAATAAAAMMRNRGIPGLVFTLEKDAPPLTQEQLQALRERAAEKMSGDRRGELLALPVPGRFETVGFTPSEMAFDKIRSLPEERITGALGIPAIVVGMGAGLDRSTFSNMQSAREYAYESFLVPLWRVLAHQLSHQLVPLFGDDPQRTRLHFNVSEVRALQESESARHGRIGKDYRAGVITRGEARTDLGYAPRADDEVFYTDTIHRMERIVDDITPQTDR